MFRYKINVVRELKKAGYSTYRIRKEKIFGQSTLTQLNNGILVSFNVFDKICTMLNCDVGDIIEHVKEEE